MIQIENFEAVYIYIGDWWRRNQEMMGIVDTQQQIDTRIMRSI
jgi:hypothetical protein